MAETMQPVAVLADRYALEEELGRSRTGLVCRSTDPLLRRAVAVKLVHPYLADDPVFAEALRAQARRVAAVSVPGIARLLDTGEQDGVVYLVREYAPGESLRSRLDRDGTASPEETARIGAALLRVLAEAHDRDVLHLSLDPDDVIVGVDGSVHLIDLGIGGAIAASRANESASLLGEDYLAPEQIAGGGCDARTDVYAVAAVLFDMLTGEPPRGRTSARAVREAVPRSLDRAIARGLDPDPERRYADARSFADALERSIDAHQVDAPEEERSNVFAWIGVPVLVVGLAAVLITLGLWFGELEVGGPLGIRPAAPKPSPVVEIQPVAVRPLAVSAIDPFGDGSELSSNAGLAADGELSTAWKSEDYFDGELGKPGIGLLLDLGQSVEVDGVRLSTPFPGFTFGVAVGDDPNTLVDRVGDTVTSSASTRVRLQGTGRYVLVWITSVVPVDDGTRAEVAEVRVVVPSADAERLGA
jgi:eukaryotic-like serine/threonine-protein kinase